MGWTYTTVYADNVQEAFKQHFIPPKYFIESEIIRLEFNGYNAFLLEKQDNEYYLTSYLLKYSKRYCEFGYKDTAFFGSINSHLASKTMIELAKKYCSNADYFEQTIKDWENYHNEQKENKKKRQSLKVGNEVIFPNCNYGGRGGNYRWTVTAINGTKVKFNHAILRRWKSQYFEIVN